jgi:hypothetical protein
MALCLLGGELGLHIAEPWLSADIQHIRRVPAIIAELEQEDGPRVLFLGNSLTRAGIRPDRIGRILGDAKFPKVAIERIYPDDTTILDWLYLYRTEIQPIGRNLDLLVVTFARDHLDDGLPINPERLGGQFAGLGAAPEAFSKDVLSFGDRIRYLLSAVSRLWSSRERIQTRALAFLPGYRTLAPLMNTNLRDGHKEGPNPASASFDRLARFIDIVRSHGTAVVFVAAPMPRPYPLPKALRDTIRREGAELIDMQDFERHGPEDFPDHYHLAEAAAGRFSDGLARAMARSTYVRAAVAHANSPSTKPGMVGRSVRTDLH